MNLDDFQNRCVYAASRYLERRGYEVIDTYRDDSGNTFLLAADDDIAVVAAVTGSRDAEKFAEKPSQEAFEGAMVALLSNYDAVDRPVRPDHIMVHALSSDRALLRHHQSCIGGLPLDAPEVDL